MLGALGRAAQATVGVVVPPAANSEEESRLPIFESVESDWFRRSRRGGDTAVVPTRPTETWSSPADAGWQAAEVASAPVSDGLTAAGLPQRVPKANLVPGRIGLADAATQPAPARSAEQLQARLASFQRAVRDARAAAQAEGAEEDPGQAADLSTPGQAADLSTPATRRTHRFRAGRACARQARPKLRRS
jgi:hypothetical protein